MLCYDRSIIHHDDARAEFTRTTTNRFLRQLVLWTPGMIRLLKGQGVEPFPPSLGSLTSGVLSRVKLLGPSMFPLKHPEFPAVCHRTSPEPRFGRSRVSSITPPPRHFDRCISPPTPPPKPPSPTTPPQAHLGTRLISGYLSSCLHPLPPRLIGSGDSVRTSHPSPPCAFVLTQVARNIQTTLVRHNGREWGLCATLSLSTAVRVRAGRS